MRINFEQAKEFLENIKETDKVAILTHTDLDGFSAGILYRDFCLKKNVKELEVFVVDYGSGQKVKDFTKKLINKNKILVSDLPPEVVLGLNELKQEIFYTDHHQAHGEEFSDNIFELRTVSEGYFPSSRTVYELCGGKDWIALAGVISDFADAYKENDVFIKEILEKNNFKLQDFKENIVFYLGRYLIYFADNLDEAFKNLQDIEITDLKKLDKYCVPVEEEIASVLSRYEKEVVNYGKIHFFCIEPKFLIKSYVINVLSSKNPKEVYCLGVFSKDLLKISFRNQQRIYNLDKFVRKIIENISGAIGGGHIGAAAAVIKKDQFDQFKKNLKNIDIEEFKI